MPVQNIVGLDGGLAPDQHQAIAQDGWGIFKFSCHQYTLCLSGTALLGYEGFLDPFNF